MAKDLLQQFPTALIISSASRGQQGALAKERLTRRILSSAKLFYLSHVVLVTVAMPTSAQELIWAISGTSQPRGIQGFDLADTQLRDIFLSQTLVYSLAVDQSEDMLYWTTPSDPSIRRTKLDGSSSIETVLSGSGNLSNQLNSIAVDPVGQKIYWTQSNLSPAIRRANLDGTNVETISLHADNPNRITVDSINEKLYWVDSGHRAVYSSNLDGSNQVSLFSSMTANTVPIGVALDSTTGTLYWSEYQYTTGFEVIPGAGRIMALLLNTLQVTPIVTGLDRPQALTIAPQDGLLYWGDSTSDLVQSSTTSGSNIQTVYDFVNEAPNNSGGITDLVFVTIPEPHALALLILPLVFVSASRSQRQPV